jgi:hypothetical protein
MRRVTTRTDTQLAVPPISHLRVSGGVAEMEAKMTWKALLNWEYLSHRGTHAPSIGREPITFCTGAHRADLTPGA